MIKNCHMRHENGNCLPAGGFCTANKNICEALHNAYELGRKYAQPEQKKGEWVLGFNNQYLEKYYYCSKCGSRKYEEHKPLDYFCSNCGADMRGEKDE